MVVLPPAGGGARSWTQAAGGISSGSGWAVQRRLARWLAKQEAIQEAFGWAVRLAAAGCRARRAGAGPHGGRQQPGAAGRNAATALCGGGSSSSSSSAGSDRRWSGGGNTSSSEYRMLAADAMHGSWLQEPAAGRGPPDTAGG